MAFLALASACVDHEDMSPGASAPAGAASADKLCPRSFVVDDMEDTNNQVLSQVGRGGYWYTFADKAGSTIDPPAGGHFAMSPGGANGSAYAARARGKLAASGAPIFAGMGFSFTDPKSAYDASRYSGVTFFARIEGASAASVRLKVPDVDTDPDGRGCTECFNDFGADLAMTDTWTRYTVPFDRMTQMEGWGAPRPGSIDKTKIYGVQWQATQPGATFDVWVDDVAFTGCP
jgi:endoglucanase